MEHLLNDPEDDPISTRIFIGLVMKRDIAFWVLKKWEMRRQHDQNFPMVGKSL